MVRAHTNQHQLNHIGYHTFATAAFPAEISPQWMKQVITVEMLFDTYGHQTVYSREVICYHKQILLVLPPLEFVVDIGCATAQMKAYKQSGLSLHPPRQSNPTC